MMKSRCDHWLEPYYARLPFRDYTLLDRAARTLERNSGGLRINVNYPWAPLRGIMPSDQYFPGVWNWDSAFHAMGVVKWDVELAKDQIRIFQKIQQDDGMFPDVWWFKDGSIFSGGSKPPVLPWAAWIIEEHSSDLEFLASAYQSFVRNEEFWMKKRGGETHGLFFYDGNSCDPAERQKFAGWESGWDDSPRWDSGVRNIFAIDLNCYMVIFYRNLKQIAEKLNLPKEAKVWQHKADLLTARIERSLWCEDEECYLDYDYEKDTFVRTITPASFMPLFIASASPERAEKMERIARAHLTPGWPSVSYLDPAYDPVGYWRGRTWLNIAYFALKGLKQYGFHAISDEGRATLLSWVSRDPGAIYENYNSQNGLPVGAPNFGWSSTFVIKFLLEWEK